MNLSAYDIIYFIIITIIVVLFTILGLDFLKDLTNDMYVIYVFLGFCIFSYLSFVGIYFFGLSIKSIFLFLSGLFLLLTIAFFLVIWYAPSICAGANISNHFLYFVITIAEFIIIILSLTSYSRGYIWEFKDTVMLFASLIILRLMYWITETNGFTWAKTICDITLILIVILCSFRFYKVLRN